MSLKEGATNRREEIARIESWCLKASSSANGVKKVEMVGTSILSLDLAIGASWWLTTWLVVSLAGPRNTHYGPE